MIEIRLNWLDVVEFPNSFWFHLVKFTFRSISCDFLVHTTFSTVDFINRLCSWIVDVCLSSRLYDAHPFFVDELD